MLFFTSASDNQYCYDFNSNKIFRIPERWVEKLKQGQNQLVIQHLKTAGVIETSGLSFKGPEKDWHKKRGEIGALILNVTDACNLRCTYCAYSEHYPFERSHGNSVMSFDVAKKSIDYYLSNSQNVTLRSVSMYGGEPTLAKQLVRRIVAYTKNYADNIIFSINSNAMSMPDSWIDFLVTEKMELQISLDGSHLVHDRYRKDKCGRDTHATVMSNLQRIAERAPDYYRNKVSFIATLAPPYQLITLYEFQRCNEILRHQAWFINYVKLLDTTFFEIIDSKPLDFTLSYDDQVSIIAKDYIEAAINGEAETHFGYWMFGDLLKAIHKRSMSPSRDVWINGSCVPGVDKLFVDTNGNYFPCERSGGFMKLGDSSNGLSLDNVVELVASYVEDCQKNCAECPNVRFCDTCYLASRRENHLELSRKYEYCGKRINKLTIALHIYTSILEKNASAFYNWQ